MMDEEVRHDTVEEALAAVDAARAAEQERHATELARLDAELDSLGTAIDNLRAQLEQLSSYRAEIAERPEPSGDPSQLYEAVYGSLELQVGPLRERAEQFARAERERDAAHLATLRERPELSRLMVEVEQYQSQLSSALGALPASYRSAIEAHHHGVLEKLATAVAAAPRLPASIDASPLEFDIVFAVDPAEGPPEIVTLVAPIDEQAHAAWMVRDDDLLLRLGARLVGALYRVANQAGLPASQVAVGGHRGMLALELDAAGAAVEDLPGQVSSAVEAALAEGAEVSGANVKARLHHVSLDALLPPDLDADEED